MDPDKSPVTDKGNTGRKFINLGRNDIVLIYKNARYYVSYIYRMASPDTIVPNYENPQSLNRYTYVLNSPLNYTDPTGHIECEAGNASCVIPPPLPHPGVPKIQAHRNIPTPNREFIHPLTSIQDPTIAQHFSAEHDGVDYGEAEGTSIFSSTLGIVVVSSGCRLGDCVREIGSNAADDNRQTGANNGYGHMVLVEYSYDVLPDETRETYGLQSEESLYVLYAHMLSPSSLQAGDIVHAGDEIGQIGNSGNSDGNHLHVEVRVGRSEQIFTTGHFCEVSCGTTDARNTWFGLDLVNPELIWE